MRRRNNNRQSIGDNDINNPGAGVRTQQGIGQKNMKKELCNIELFSFENRDLVASFNEDGSVATTEVEAKKGMVSYGLTTGEVRVDYSDGTGFSVTINPIITNKIIEWISSNMEKSAQQDALRKSREAEQHEERMKSLRAETERNKLHLEEEKLRHEIKMVELKIELTEKRKELREAEAADEIIGDGQELK